MQNRRNFIIQSSLAAGAFTILKPFKGFAVFDGSVNLSTDRKTVTILHTANIKGQATYQNGLGGLKGIQEAINKIKKENKNILLLDAGDVINGVNKAKYDQKFLAALDKIGFDAILPGNKDMLNGEMYFADMVEGTHLKVIATNYHQQQVLAGIALPYYIVKKGDVKIGIIGLANTTKIKTIATSSLQQNVSLVNKTSSILKQKHNCCLVICLTHEGFRQESCRLKDDITFATMLTDVDVVISGSESKNISNTHLVNTTAGQEVIVSTSGYKGAILGRIDITFNDFNEKVNVAVKQVIISSDKNNMAALNSYASALIEA